MAASLGTADIPAFMQAARRMEDKNDRSRTSVYRDGAALVRLPLNSDIIGAQAPSWSPDSRSIVLSDINRNLLVVNADGGGILRAIGYGRQWDWQP
jgi:hypothetical protein